METLQTYNNWGRLTQTKDANENTVMLGYDTIGRLTSQTNSADSSMRSYQYFTKDNYVEATNENGVKMKQTYDHFGRKKKTYVQNDGGVYDELQSYTYYPNSGNVKTVEQLAGNDSKVTGTYEWDDLGRMKSSKIVDSNAAALDSRTMTHGVSDPGESIWQSKFTAPTATPTPVETNGSFGGKLVKNERYISKNATTKHTLNKQYTLLAMDVSGSVEVLNDANQVIKTATDTCIAVDVSGIGTLTLKGVSSTNIYNARVYTPEQLAGMGPKVTTQATNNSGVTPAAVTEQLDIWGQSTITTAGSVTEKRQYDWVGNLVKHTDPNQVMTQYEYDFAGNLLKESLPTAGKPSDYTPTVYTYDRLGRKLTEKDSRGNLTSFTYNVLGWVKTVDNAAGGHVEYTYDKNGNVIAEKTKRWQSETAPADQKHSLVNTQYDGRNRPVAVTQYENYLNETEKPHITQYYYDKMGNPLRVYTGLTAPLTINGLDQVTAGADTVYEVTKYDYNYMGYLTQTTFPDGKTEKNVRLDKRGNVLEKTDKNGDTLKYDYTWSSLPTTIWSSKENRNMAQYSYDMLGNRTRRMEIYASGITTTTYQYDSLHRLVKETQGETVKDYTYDNAGGRKSFTLTVNKTALMKNEYTYGWANTLTKMVSTRGALVDTVDYTYNGAGQPTKRTVGSKVTDIQYDNGNRISVLDEKWGGASHVKTTNGYHPDGNVKSTNVARTVGTVVTAYTYDGMGRLTDEQSPLPFGGTYTYDDYGNRKTKNGETYEYATGNLLTKTSGESKQADYLYDGNGNLSSKLTGSLAPADDGRVDLETPQGAGADNNVNQYDALNRLTKSVSGDQTGEYTYNGDGLRTAKKVNGVETRLILDGADVVAEIQGSNITLHVRADQLITTSKSNGERIYYNYNAHGDVMQLVNAAGEVTKNYTYDAFGVEQNIDPNDTNPFRYCGEYYDAESGYIYLRARYYDPATSRFVSEDPHWNPGNMIYGDKEYKEGEICIPDIEAIMQSSNLYVYAMNNPIKYIDPSGLVATGYVGVHKVAFDNYHASIVIVVDKDSKYYNDSRFKTVEGTTLKYITIGAGPDYNTFGKDGIVPGINREKDANLTNKVELKPFDHNLSDDKIGEFLQLTENFKSNNSSLDYDMFPSDKNDGYNSNSFTRGLLNAAGYDTSKLKPSFNVPGWSKPIPVSYFKKKK